MRHLKRGRSFSRRSNQRKALFKSLMNALFKYETIKTTLPKAKDLRPLAEKMITLAKTDTVARRRLVFARLRDEAMVKKLFTEIAPRSKERPGGYIRILKCGYRFGDKAPMAYVQWVDSPALENL